MRLFPRLLIAASLVLALPACASDSPSETAAEEGEAPAMAENDTDKTFYALGLILSQQLKQLSVSEAELQHIKSGLTDGILDNEPMVDIQEYGPKVNELAQARAAKVAESEKGEAVKFVEEMATMEGAQQTDSGLVYTEIEAGDGATPEATNKVKVHYHGTLRDGTVFDSSVDRGTPAEFPLNGVIPCWTEGVQMMKVGGKAKLVCPPDIAYGERGAPPSIKPNAALVFEVELLEIVE